MNLNTCKRIWFAAAAFIAAPWVSAAEPVTEQAIGERLLATAALAARAGIDPEQALRDATARFEARIRARE